MVKEAVQKGAFVKHCPCSPGAVPCGYFNLNLQSGCPFDCSYCILQAYLDDKEQGVFYTNWTDLEAELRKFLSANREVRIGSGELSDSLAFENVRPSARRLAEMFREFPDTVFEFKTKAVAIQALLDVKDPPGNIVVSWSLNPAPLIRGEEHLTPSLDQRLQALETVQTKGYTVGIHFDRLAGALPRTDPLAVPGRSPRPRRLVEPGRPAFPPGVEKPHIPPSRFPVVLGRTHRGRG
jgi:spore photoproduct lyase